MKHYTVAELEVTDPSWVRDYVNDVTAMVEAHGGRYLARTGQAELFEGERELPAGGAADRVALAGGRRGVL